MFLEYKSAINVFTVDYLYTVENVCDFAML